MILKESLRNFEFCMNNKAKSKNQYLENQAKIVEKWVFETIQGETTKDKNFDGLQVMRNEKLNPDAGVNSSPPPQDLLKVNPLSPSPHTSSVRNSKSSKFSKIFKNRKYPNMPKIAKIAKTPVIPNIIQNPLKIPKNLLVTLSSDSLAYFSPAGSLFAPSWASKPLQSLC